MTFEVYLDGKLLYYPNDETYEIANGVVESALNEAGSFECDIPKNNPLYDSISLRSSMIQVKQNGEEIFYGEVREVTQNFDFTKHIYAVGELAFLFDSIQPQARYQTALSDIFKNVITKHNNQVEARKQFSVGYITGSIDSDYVFTNYEDTLTFLREKLCKDVDGYLRIRKSDGKKYLDIVPLEAYGNECKQEIQFGENLLKYASNSSAVSIATAVIPLGAKLDEENRTDDAVKLLDEYLTVKGKEGTDYNYDKDYVFIQSAVNRFGWVKVVKHWDDVTTKKNLKKKAEEWLKSVQFETMELEINAFDGNLLDVNVDAFRVGDRVHAWAIPYGMDTMFPVRKKKTYINDLSKNYITLGTTQSTSYTQQASTALSAVSDEIPETSAVLQSAKDNALAMLNGSVGGHVIMKFDSTNTYVEEILICNASTEANSTNKWVWNVNGLGFMRRNNTSSPWQSATVPVAITMDGKIVADYITTGTMTADRVRGGAFAIGGLNNTNGTLNIYNAQDQLIGSWNNAGINVQAGQLKIGNNFNVGLDGKLTCNNANVTGIIKTDEALIGGWNVNANGMGKYPNSNQTERMEIGVSGNLSSSDNNAIRVGKKVNGTFDYPFIVNWDGKLSCKGADISGEVNINSGSIAIGDDFKVTKTGKLSCKGADIAGKLNAESGTIGSNTTASKRWQIGDKSIYKGCKSLTSTEEGMYVGTDGIRTNKTIDGATAYTTISGGAIKTNQTIDAAGFFGNTVGTKKVAPTETLDLTSCNVKIGDAKGVTTAIPVMVGTNKYKTVTIVNGIITEVKDV